MRTVSAIITSVYENDAGASAALRVTRPAVCNWKAKGCFPTRLIAVIFEHARAKGESLELSEIPTFEHPSEPEARKPARPLSATQPADGGEGFETVKAGSEIYEPLSENPTG